MTVHSTTDQTLIELTGRLIERRSSPLMMPGVRIFFTPPSLRLASSEFSMTLPT